MVFSQLIVEFEAIDELVGKLMYKAEQGCRKLRTGTIAWSPTYKAACLTLEYWLHRRTYFKGNHSNVRQLLVLQNKLNLSYDPTLSLQEIETNIKVAYGKRQECKKYAESLSLEYRMQLAMAKEEAGDVSMAFE